MDMTRETQHVARDGTAQETNGDAWPARAKARKNPVPAKGCQARKGSPSRKPRDGRTSRLISFGSDDDCPASSRRHSPSLQYRYYEIVDGRIVNAFVGGDGAMPTPGASGAIVGAEELVRLGIDPKDPSSWIRVEFGEPRPDDQPKPSPKKKSVRNFPGDCPEPVQIRRFPPKLIPLK